MIPVRINTNLLLKTAHALSAVLLLLLSAYCLFYLFSGLNYLQQWYIGLNSCFYRHEYLTSFFTKGIKSDGNTYCNIALLWCGAGIINAVRKFRSVSANDHKQVVLELSYKELWLRLGCVLCCIAAWYWGNRQTSPAYDEVFSGNVAAFHPFQTISYYVIPNNHLLFNLINNLLFHYFPDKVMTGRWISLTAYICVVQVLISLLLKWLGNIWLACAAAVMLSLQFFIWGFSFQARSYELCLLAEIGAFTSLFYYAEKPEKWLLPINLLCCVTGYFCVPSFLYFHMAQVLCMGVYQLVYRKKDITFWKYQVITVLVVFLCYVPALSISGLDALANNRYVTPMTKFKTNGEFCKWMWDYFQPFAEHIFSDVRLFNYSLNIAMLALPLLLLLWKNKKTRFAGIFFLCLWASFFTMVIIMKRVPFERNLIGHYNITLLFLVILVFEILRVAAKKSQVWVLGVPFLCFVSLWAIHFVKRDRYYLERTLYEYNVNREFKELKNGLKFIPAGKTAAFSNEGFYCYYICREKGCIAHRCIDGGEDYYVKNENEPLPHVIKDKFMLVYKINEYEIYLKSP